MTTKIYINNHTVLPATKLCTSSFFPVADKKGNKMLGIMRERTKPITQGIASALQKSWMGPGLDCHEQFWSQLRKDSSKGQVNGATTIQERQKKISLGLFGLERRSLGEATAEFCRMMKALVKLNAQLLPAISDLEGSHWKQQEAKVHLRGFKYIRCP